MQSKCYSVIFFVLMFFFISYFFIKVHPLYVFDTDDWLYIQDSRDGKAWPVWGAWNPTRVFPEIFMPFISWLSVIFFYPFNSDYIESLSVGFALTLSLFIIVVGIIFSKILEVIFNFKRVESLFFSLLFCLFFFYPLYRHSNLYLLRAVDVSCVFYYIIPALLNGSIVLWFVSFKKHNTFKDVNYLELSILIIFVYFALNSNLFESIVFVSYVISSILLFLFYEIKKGNCFILSNLIKNCIKNNLFYFCIVISYLVVLIFEANGGRASCYSADGVQLNINSSFKAFIHCIEKLHQAFHILLFMNLVGLLVYFYRKRKHKLQYIDDMYIDVFAKLGFSLTITVTFLILLCARTGSGYLSRTDVSLSYYFYILTISFCSIAYLYKLLCNRYRFMLCFLPLISILFISKVLFYGVRYAETSYAHFPISIVKSISDDLISQIVTADKSGVRETDVYVPDFLESAKDNFPLALYGAQRLPSALYNHRIISHDIKVKFVPDSSLNRKYRIE